MDSMTVKGETELWYPGCSPVLYCCYQSELHRIARFSFHPVLNNCPCPTVVLKQAAFSVQRPRRTIWVCRIFISLSGNAKLASALRLRMCPGLKHLHPSLYPFCLLRMPGTESACRLSLHQPGVALFLPRVRSSFLTYISLFFSSFFQFPSSALSCFIPCVLSFSFSLCISLLSFMSK
jgi:hypothetical protein